MSTSYREIDAPKALRAARALLADPGNLPQVFTLLEAMSGGTLVRIKQRLEASAAGAKLLAEQPDITRLFDDREALRRLPDGSLGRAYLAFVESENISAAGIRDAAEEGLTGALAPPADEAFVHARMRDTHDLWHAITGYRGDLLGETALLAFTFAQTKNPGIFVLVALGLYKIGAPNARSVILEAYRRGRDAKWFPEQDWESMLAEPVAEVRARLGVSPLTPYQPVRVDANGAFTARETVAA